MHTRTTGRAALAVGAAALLAITGCTAADEAESADALEAEQANYPVPGGEPDDAEVIDVEEEALEPEDWADEKIQAWLDHWNLDDVSGLNHPFNKIESWEAGDDGELIVHASSDLREQDLNLTGAVLMNDTWDENTDLDTVTVRTTDGELSEEYARQDHIGSATSGENDVDTQAWADELMELWVTAEGADSIDGMLYPYHLITSWEAPGDGELTVYADPSVLDDPHMDEPGELGHLYGISTMIFDRLYCGVEDLEAVTVTTTDGADSHTRDRQTQAEQHLDNYGACES